VALAAMAWGARRRPDREAVWLFVSWTVGLAAVTLVQKRFFNSLSVSLALAFGWSVVALHGALASRARSRVARLVLTAAVAAGVLLLLAPTRETYLDSVTNLGRAVRGEPLRRLPSQLELARAVEAAVWIRKNTPATGGFLDAGVRPEWGILSLSGIGHVLEYVARRPTVTNNFGDDIGRPNYEAAQRYLAEREEPEAERIADELGARYVLVSAPTVPGGRVPAHPPMQRLLAQYDGRGLGGHRMLFEGSHPQRGGSTPYKLFERVKGARLRGRTLPGAAVTARLELRTNRGRPVAWRTRTTADETGTYLLRLPYANGAAPPSLQTAESYRIEAGGCGATASIEEGQVAEGEEVRGPDLCCDEEACDAASSQDAASGRRETAKRPITATSAATASALCTAKMSSTATQRTSTAWEAAAAPRSTIPAPSLRTTSRQQASRIE
jgi:dolichyl-diphosphooligosaccharide--protein glycosyltransferase